MRSKYADCSKRLLLSSEYTNAWSSISFPDGAAILLEYANLGIRPQAILNKDLILIGAGQYVHGVDAKTMELRFTYKVPFVFYEFIEFDDDKIIIVDELGFVSLEKDGREAWIQLLDNPLGPYTIAGKSITGATIEGDRFEFTGPV